MIISIEMIINELKKHGVSKAKRKEVYDAYLLADRIHLKQRRESDEPYIIHPLNVAYNVVEMGVYDPDTICAALLHDTIEDAGFNFTKENLQVMTNSTVAELVDGVTKLHGVNFESKSKKEAANIRKLLVNGLCKDIRIIIIKLADRLHNMRTLEHKTPQKQKENALETLEIFVPLANIIGAYKLKNELAELSFKYINPTQYKKLVEMRNKLKEEDNKVLKKMASTIEKKLKAQNIKGKIVFKTQSLYTIKEKIEKGYKIENQYDLNYFKIIVPTIDDCYRVLGIVHSCYSPINGRLKDYIGNPKKNNYQSLHTTVSNEKRFWKIKIRTEEMDKIDANGIAAYWNIKDYNNLAPIEYGKTIEETNEIIRNQCQSSTDLSKINENASDDTDFMKKITEIILSKQVYVYTNTGTVKELPAGSTVLNFIYEVYPDKMDSITSVVINGKEIELPKDRELTEEEKEELKLKDYDRIQVLENGKIINEDSEKTKIKTKKK